MKQILDQRCKKAIAIVTILVAMVFLISQSGQSGYLVLMDGKSGEIYAKYPMQEGDAFCIGFIHSVNKSPLTDIYEIRDGNIYVTKTIYYGFGAGVQTLLEDGQTLTYGEDGSMVITGFEQKMENLQYIVGTVSDHILTLNDSREVSLRDLCGRNSLVQFRYER